MNIDPTLLEIAKVAGTAGAALGIGKKAGEAVIDISKKIADETLCKLSGGVATDIGELARSPFQQWGYKRRVRFVEDLAQELTNAGVTNPRPVAFKMLFPAIENACFEEPESELYKRYLNLLTNAANPGNPDTVHPYYLTILKDLTAIDVAVLNAIASSSKAGGGALMRTYDLQGVAQAANVIPKQLTPSNVSPPPAPNSQFVINDQDTWNHVISVLYAKQLLEQVVPPTLDNMQKLSKDSLPFGPPNMAMLDSYVRLTPLGRKFVEACREPKKKS